MGQRTSLRRRDEAPTLAPRCAPAQNDGCTTYVAGHHPGRTTSLTDSRRAQTVRATPEAYACRFRPGPQRLSRTAPRAKEDARAEDRSEGASRTPGHHGLVRGTHEPAATRRAPTSSASRWSGRSTSPRHTASLRCARSRRSHTRPGCSARHPRSTSPRHFARPWRAAPAASEPGLRRRRAAPSAPSPPCRHSWRAARPETGGPGSRKAGCHTSAGCEHRAESLRARYATPLDAPSPSSRAAGRGRTCASSVRPFERRAISSTRPDLGGQRGSRNRSSDGAIAAVAQRVIAHFAACATASSFAKSGNAAIFRLSP